MATVTSYDGTRIAFEQMGSGPALILVDGVGGFRRLGPTRSLANHLADRFTVTIYDRRGRGESGDTAPYAVERELEDLAAVIAACGGSAFVHGFSSGAALALLGAAAGLPISMLSLLDPPIDLQRRQDFDRGWDLDQRQDFDRRRDLDRGRDLDRHRGESDPGAEYDLAAEIEELVAADRRDDAIEHFHASIGVPSGMVAGMWQDPFFPMLAAIAHTFAYDLRIASAVSPATLRSVTGPVLVIGSASGAGRMSADVAAALPRGRHVNLKGERYAASGTVPASMPDSVPAPASMLNSLMALMLDSVLDSVLASVLADFFVGGGADT